MSQVTCTWCKGLAAVTIERPGEPGSARYACTDCASEQKALYGWRIVRVLGAHEREAQS